MVHQFSCAFAHRDRLGPGALREEFTAFAVEQHGVSLRYAKSTRGAKTPDYLIEIDGTPIVGEPAPAGSSGVRRVPLHALGFA